MPIDYDPAVIEEFFGSLGVFSEAQDANHRIRWIEYAAPRLKYVITLHLDAEAVGVSGDFTVPFGAHSLYEVCVPCSTIVAGPDPYREKQVCLSLFYGGQDIAQHRRMTIMKGPEGELKVWPQYSFPSGHVYHKDADSPRT